MMMKIASPPLPWCWLAFSPADPGSEAATAFPGCLGYTGQPGCLGYGGQQGCLRIRIRTLFIWHLLTDLTRRLAGISILKGRYIIGNEIGKNKLLTSSYQSITTNGCTIEMNEVQNSDLFHYIPLREGYITSSNLGYLFYKSGFSY